MENFTVNFKALTKTTEDVDMADQSPVVKDLLDSIGESKMKRSSSGTSWPRVSPTPSPW